MEPNELRIGFKLPKQTLKCHEATQLFHLQSIRQEKGVSSIDLHLSLDLAANKRVWNIFARKIALVNVGKR